MVRRVRRGNLRPPVGAFDKGVYTWLQNEAVPGTNDAYRGHRDPAEQETATVMQAAWRDYRKAKALRDQELAQRGLTSIQSKGAEDIQQAWSGFLDQMNSEYGDPWRVEFNSYQNSSALYLTAIQNAMDNRQFMQENGNTPLWQSIREYMATRQNALDAIAAGNSSTDVKKWFTGWAGQFQYSNLAFSDFYDRFLSQDQLTDLGLEVAA